MAYSSGVFSRLYNWVTDRDGGVKIQASRMDAEMDGFATGLSTCVLKDGTQTITANIPMSSFKFTGLAAGSTAGDSVRYEQVFGGSAAASFLDTTTFVDTGDDTKKVRLDAGGITTATTRVLTAPDFDGTIATTGGTETLTNKSLSDSTTSFVDNSDNTKALQFQCSGITTSTTRTVTWPDQDGTVLLTTGGQTLSGAINFADNTLQRPKLIDYGETVNALGDLGGGTDNIDLESGNVVTATVSTSTQTFTFSNPPASGTCGSFTLILTNGGSQTVNWPASVDWAGGNAPNLTASGVDVLMFFTTDGGTTWYGFSAGLDMQ